MHSIYGVLQLKSIGVTWTRHARRLRLAAWNRGINVTEIFTSPTRSWDRGSSPSKTRLHYTTPIFRSLARARGWILIVVGIGRVCSDRSRFRSLSLSLSLSGIPERRTQRGVIVCGISVTLLRCISRVCRPVTQRSAVNQASGIIIAWSQCDGVGRYLGAGNCANENTPVGLRG